MFAAIFKDQSWFLFVVAVITVILACGVYSLARKHGQRPYAFAALTAVTVVEVSVTLAMPNGGRTTDVCVLNRDLVEPFLTTQGLLNLAMFLPLGFVGVLAARSVVPVVLGSAALSLLSEVCQAVVPGIGRNCDSSDFFMNTLGGILGAAAAYAVLRMTGSVLQWDRYWRPAVVGAVVAGLVVGVTGFTLITITPMDSTSLQFADGSQKEAAEAAIRQAFGSHYTVTQVQYQPAAGSGTGGNLLLRLDEGKASAQLTWPDKRALTVSLENSSKVTAESFPIPGSRVKPDTAQSAQRIAQTYAQKFYPASMAGAKTIVKPVGAKAELGWMVSWRRTNADGVLMPMRLDVEVNRAGRISQLVSSPVNDPQNLPPITLSRKAAEEKALKSIHGYLQTTPLKVSGVRLQAMERAGKWRSVYLFTYRTDKGDEVMSVTYVDATTGQATSE
ncbi:VanZ family protein [Actinacidiphila oryziradicis]|uniref:VanZ family protein n=1 Tax=Actinacidiphila oryziradicis TaxID=2571141 RepID=A0A4U0RTS5_9ACTN|nr:VanZ family protein [Actinacidiphila oryziradicis]TJZ99509.1 VanZ family protein [Actinacidiphila oryziradicis]